MTNYRFIGKNPLELTPVQGVQRHINANICTQLLNLLYEQRKHRDYKAVKKIVYNAQKVGMTYEDVALIGKFTEANYKEWQDILILLGYVSQGVTTIRFFEKEWQDYINEDEEISDPSEADF